ncbi:MAG: glycosyltransferase [Clostridiales bacterium]|nr:glycosyltransferase [Clostridiales bacterium]
MENNILIFSSRELCYLSGSFFANQIGAAFEELGYGVEICELSPEDDLDEALSPYMGKPYRLILDFNSKLPRLVMEDDVPYLDKLNGPFFDYILDHPLFHYNGLSCPVKNLNALVLDEAQAEYVRRYHPHLASVHMLPLGATKALYQGEKEQECRIFVPGSYDCPGKFLVCIEDAKEPLRTWMKVLAERRIDEPTLPMEEAFRQLLVYQGRELSDEQFALAMNAMYPVDAYVRAYFRKAVMDRLLSDRIPITVMGGGWEQYKHAGEQYLQRENQVSFGLSFECMAKKHILLNVTPMFNRGMHDRIPAGMANRAVVLTDENPYLKQHFVAGKQMCFYSLANLHSILAQAWELTENKGLREQIQEEAYLEFKEHHTWKCRVKELLSFL